MLYLHVDYFKEQLVCLQEEWKIDKEQFEERLLKSSLKERKIAGNTWYPLIIKDVEPAMGDYITVVLERTNGLNESHNFRFGMPACLFSNNDAHNNRIEGVIKFANLQTIKLHIRTEELPDWADNGKLGLDLLFDENSYKEMQFALNKAEEAFEANSDLVKILIGDKKVAPNAHQIKYENDALNESQKMAVKAMLSNEPVVVIHGPPGTGKTTTITNGIKALWQTYKEQILVCAPSNTAVDLLTEKLDKLGLNVVRIGNPVRIGAHLQALTLDAKISTHAANKNIKAYKRQASEYKKMALKYKRNYGKAEREQRNLLLAEARKLMKDVSNEEQYISTDILDKCQVITATLVGANNYNLQNKKFNTVVIDEAGQALEPSCWIPILKAQRVIFAGDHLQLPPTVKNNASSSNTLLTTLFEKNIKLHKANLLNVQYRMHEAIMSFSNHQFYNGELIAHDTNKLALLKEQDAPILFVDTAGCGFEELSEETSLSNPEEASFTLKILAAQLAEYNNLQLSIGVITPYKKQAILLNELLLHSEELLDYKQLAINTIDSFQGQERDVIIISLVRSNTNNIIGFLSDTRRMNVALTRAKKKLIVIGDSATISSHPFYDAFINYTQSIDAYKSAWEFM